MQTLEPPTMSILPLNQSRYELLIDQRHYRMDDPAIRQFLDDRAFMLAAVSTNGFRLQHASARLKGNRAVVSAAVAHKGLALWCASSSLRDDRAVVTHAVTQDGGALKYASAAVRASRAVVLAAVAQDGRAIQFAAPSLRDGGLRAYVRAELFALRGFKTFLLAARARRLKPAAQPPPTDDMDISSSSSKLRGAAAFDDEVAVARLEKLGCDAGRHVMALVAAFAGVMTVLDPELRAAVHSAARNLGLGS
jgi:hypothetical protein